MTRREYIEKYSEEQLAFKLSLEAAVVDFYNEYFVGLLDYIEGEIRKGVQRIQLPTSIHSVMREHAGIIIENAFRGQNLSNFDSSVLLSILVNRANERISTVAPQIDQTTYTQINRALTRAIEALDVPYRSEQVLIRVLAHLREIWGRRAVNITTSETQVNLETLIFESNEYAEQQARWSLLLGDVESARQHLQASTVFSYLVLADEIERVPQEQRLVVLGNRKKMWQSMEDAKVRPSHALVSGETIGKDDFFEVGGFPMRYPGDPLAPAQETANCRCVCIYL